MTASPQIATIVGARPQFIKAAPISQALAKAGLREAIIHTGQHYDPEMSDVFFSELGIAAPAHHLGIHGGGHGEMTGRMMIALEQVFLAIKPAMVMVYGDTNSTLAGALVATKLHLPLAHVEAGLRSFNRAMPEEANRVLTDHVSDILFTPTARAVENLAREGISRGVHQVGDVMYDATLAVAERARRQSTILNRLHLQPGDFVVATVHRAENTDDPARLAAIVDYLRQQAARQPVVLPLHPRTKAAAERQGLSLSGLQLCPPLGYLDMARLLEACAGVFTDSGGLQKEAYFHRKPCVTLRMETEWVETVECGWNRLWQGADYQLPRRDIADYGDGNAAGRIAAILGEAVAAKAKGGA